MTTYSGVNPSKARAILGDEFPTDGNNWDWYIGLHKDGSETLEAHGFDEPFAWNNSSTSWTSPGSNFT